MRSHAVRGRWPGAARPAGRWLLGALVCLGGAPAPAAGQPEAAPPSRDPPTWRVQPAVHADLWFHALAVIGADEPGPLGLYSADYAQRIREVKRAAGVFPTMLDSLAPELRRAFLEDSALSVLHFAPLFFRTASPEQMLAALEAVGERKLDDRKRVGPAVASGVRRIAFDVQKGGSRRVLRTLVQAVRREWEVFYRSYVDSLHAAQAERYRAMQVVWDSVISPPLKPYLTERRLAAGVVMPSPGIGPEGRIVTGDPLAVRAGDNVASVMLPLFTDAPTPSAFALLKELCFPIVDDALRGVGADTALIKTPGDLENLRRTAAVRCGAVLLEFYAPTFAAGYRRAFLDAVGATESYTVRAFERVYALDAPTFERLREEIRRRR